MKSMVIGGIILIVALMAGTYFVAGDSFSLGEDYINDLTMLAGLAILAITIFVALKYINQIKNDTATGELKEDNWDGIGEYGNPVPSGWAIAYIGTIVWMLWYWLAGYPTNAFSQIGQYNEEVSEHKVKFESKWADISNDDLRAMGESVFLVQCAPCHGVDAEGIDGKAGNLVEYGHKTHIEYVINHGSKGLGYQGGEMPAGLVSGSDASAVAGYVAGGLTGGGAGAEVYMNACASCHGEDGKGMYGTFPDLTTYGTVGFATKVIKSGKIGNMGTMPSFEGRITDTQTKAVSAYILSLGE